MEVKCRFLRSDRPKRTDFSFLQDLILEILDHEEKIHDNCVRSEKFESIENCVEEVPGILLTKKLKNSDKGFFSVNTNKSEIQLHSSKKLLKKYKDQEKFGFKDKKARTVTHGLESVIFTIEIIS